MMELSKGTAIEILNEYIETLAIIMETTELVKLYGFNKWRNGKTNDPHEAYILKTVKNKFRGDLIKDLTILIVNGIIEGDTSSSE
jgi:hypothetical protein